MTEVWFYSTSNVRLLNDEGTDSLYSLYLTAQSKGWVVSNQVLSVELKNNNNNNKIFQEP